MVTLTRWYLADARADVWGDPCDYLDSLTALNNERFAQLHAEDEALVEIDHEAADAWIASRDAEYDVEVSA